MTLKYDPAFDCGYPLGVANMNKEVRSRWSHPGELVSANFKTCVKFNVNINCRALQLIVGSITRWFQPPRRIISRKGDKWFGAEGLDQLTPGALKFLAISLETSRPGAIYISSIIVRKSFWQQPGELSPSNQRAFVAHFSTDPNGMRDNIPRNIMIQYSWYGFFGIEWAAKHAMGLPAFFWRIYSRECLWRFPECDHWVMSQWLAWSRNKKSIRKGRYV